MSILISKRFTANSNFVAPAGVTSVIVQLKSTVLSPATKISGPLALKNTGEAFAWGFGTIGQLGDNTIISKSLPVQVVGGHSFIEIVTGSSYARALKSNGEIWAWGNNLSGQLGDNTIVQKSTPVQVLGGHSFTAIAKTTSNTSLALKANGEAWAWGNGSQGVLGDNSTVSKSTPVQVVGGHSFIAIAAGFAHSIALKSNGEAWTWGDNTGGQLGDNTVVAKSTPIQVVGGHSFIAVAAGASHALALKANGEVWAWGIGGTGQLGDNTIVDKSTPVQVAGGHSFTQINAGGTFSVALKANGEAWAWGQGLSGQLGDSSAISKSTPVQVVGGHSFTAITATEAATTFALKANGEIWSWGLGTTGQLGDNTSASKSSPVQVAGTYAASSSIQNNQSTQVISVVPDTSYSILIGPSGVSFGNTFIGVAGEVIVSWLA
jgi:alpha-tubulin suppressor-like RCC1 family protein